MAHLCVLESVYHWFDSPPLPSLSFPQIISLSTWHTSGCPWVPNWADWVSPRARVCVCVCLGDAVIIVDYSMLCAPALAPKFLPLSFPPPHSLCLCVSVTAAVAHWGHSVPTGQPDGSRWLVVWRGLTWHGGSQARGGQPEPVCTGCHHCNTAERMRTLTPTACHTVQFKCLTAACVTPDHVQFMGKTKPSSKWPF